MYRIFEPETDTTIVYTENIRYIRCGENGCFVEASENEAQGVAVNSMAYSLYSEAPMEGAETIVCVTEFDGASLIKEQEAIIDDLIVSSLEG